jgi:mycothiol synthase
MKPTMRTCDNEDDFWRVRNFLREVFLLNDRLEHSWHVARLDYWRWHYIKTVNITTSVEKGMALWERADGKIIAALNHLGGSELRLHVHPHFRSPELEGEMLAYAEENYYATTEDGRRYVYLPIFADDAQRQQIAGGRGYEKQSGWGHHYHRELEASIPDVRIPASYVIRSMGGAEDYPARSWASWRAFHNDEPDENYDGDFTWYANLQSAPLYRRDLDGDGDLDLVLTDYMESCKIWLNDGNGLFADSGLRFGGGQFYRHAHLGDLDGDGDLDIFLATFGLNRGPNEIWFNLTR